MESRGFGKPQILPPSTIPLVVVEEIVVSEFEKDARVWGEKRGKYCESGMLEEVLNRKVIGLIRLMI